MKVKGNTTPGGDGNSWAPGDFGLLDPPGLNSSGANLIRNLLSQQSPDFCFANNLSPRTGGAVQKVSDGLNIALICPSMAIKRDWTQQPPPILSGACTNQIAVAIRNIIVQRHSTARDRRVHRFLPATRCQCRKMPTHTIVGNMIKGTGTRTLDVTAANLYWQRHYRAIGPPLSWPLGNQIVISPIF